MKQKLIWLKILQGKDSGITLMESLVVIVILSIMVVVTTPPLILGMATRIQSRRAQSAITLAQKEIERIRLIVERGDYVNSQLPSVGKNKQGNSVAKINEIPSVAPPNKLSDVRPCEEPPKQPCDTKPDYLKAWWTDNSQEFFVQTFRDTGVTQNNQVVIFRMGVRVYSKAAKPDIGSLRTELAPLYLSTGPAQKAVVEKNGAYIKAKHSQFPLAIIYADFSRGDLVGSLERYREFVNK